MSSPFDLNDMMVNSNYFQWNHYFMVSYFVAKKLATLTVVTRDSKIEVEHYYLLICTYKTVI